MDKNSPSSIDALDQRLIELLQEDGRQSSESLAKKLEVSPSTVLRRVQQLREDGIIRIVAGVDPDKVGLLLAAVIGLDVEAARLTAVVDELAAKPAVRFVSPATGRFDVLVFGLFRSNDELADFIERELATIDGVKDTETFICLHVTKGRFAQYAPAGDCLEDRLVQLLQEDGRQSSEVLATQLGVSPSTVLRRIRELTRSGVLRIVAVVDLGKVGYPLVAVSGLDVTAGKLRAVAEALAEKQAVKFVSTTAGRYDIFAFMRFKSNEELASFIERDIGGMEGIKNTVTFICLNVRKGRYTLI